MGIINLNSLVPSVHGQSSFSSLFKKSFHSSFKTNCLTQRCSSSGIFQRYWEVANYSGIKHVRLVIYKLFQLTTNN